MTFINSEIKFPESDSFHANCISFNCSSSFLLVSSNSSFSYNKIKRIFQFIKSTSIELMIKATCLKISSFGIIFIAEINKAHIESVAETISQQFVPSCIVLPCIKLTKEKEISRVFFHSMK